jgi:hypothetical protein
MSTALVFGTSHTGPFVRGHRLARSAGLVGYDVHGMVFHGDRYEPTVHITPDHHLQFNPAITEDIAAAIEELQPSCLITAVMGSCYWSQGMSQDPRPFDFLVPELPQHKLTEETEFIPYDLLRRRFHIDLDWQFGIVRSIREFSDLPIFNIEAPPPVASEQLMIEGIGHHPAMIASLEQHGLPSVSFRYKFWWGWNDVTRCICTDLGMHFVAGPPDTRDADGYLDARFYLDGLHGTDDYGKLMAQAVERAMSDIGVVVE